MRAILSLLLPTQNLANREETIYVLRYEAHRSRHNALRKLSTSYNIVFPEADRVRDLRASRAAPYAAC